MEKEKQKSLQRKHNSFFKYINNKDYPIYRGIECGDGWYGLINAVIQDIKELCIKRSIRPSIQIMQVKEKFGELRIYFEVPANSELQEEIQKIELSAARKSRSICEDCSSPAKTRMLKSGRKKTLCWKCLIKEKLKSWKL